MGSSTDGFASSSATHKTSVAVRVCLGVSISTHRTFVAVHHTHRTSVGVYQHTQDVCGCPWLYISKHRTSVAVRVCPCVSVSTPRTSVCVCVCPSAHTGRPWLSISTHISTVVLGLSTLTLPVDCSGDFGPLGLSVQYTQVVRGSPPANTGRPWLSVCVCLCPSAHTSHPWLFISTHISTLVLGLKTLAIPVDGLGDFGPRGLSVQYKQDFRGCPPSHTGYSWLSINTHRTSVAVRVCSTHISTLVLGLSTLAHSMDCSGDFGPRGLSVQYTQDVCGCPSAHTRRLCVSVSTHRTSVAVRVCPSAHTGRPWLTYRTSVGVRQHTQDVCGCPWLYISKHRTSVAVRVSPCVSVSTHRTSVCVCVCPSAHTGRPWLSIITHISTLVLGLSTLALPVDCSVILAHVGCLFSTHRTSMGVRQHTHDVRGYPSVHKSAQTGHPCVSVSPHRTSVAVRVCPSAHTGRPWLSISTQISTLVFGLSMLALPVDYLGDFGPRGLSVQYTQDIRGCPPANTGRPWLSVCVRQHTQDVCGCPSVHISALHTGRPWVSASTHKTSVAVRGCSSAHTARPWLSVCVRVCLCVSVSTYRTSVAVCVCPSAHTGCPWLSISTHIIALVLGLSMLTLPVDCSGDFGPRGLSVQYTKDVRRCPPAHTGRPWLSVFVCVCPSVSVSTNRTFVAVHQYTYQHVGPWTQHAGPFRGLFE
ncbi:hypothetical protein YC2023_066104 [Brassica napus]